MFVVLINSDLTINDLFIQITVTEDMANLPQKGEKNLIENNT